jgi:hypothetical protein
VATAHEEDEFGDFPEQPVQRMSGSQDRTAAPPATVASPVVVPVNRSQNQDEFDDFPEQPTQRQSGSQEHQRMSCSQERTAQPPLTAASPVTASPLAVPPVTASHEEDDFRDFPEQPTQQLSASHDRVPAAVVSSPVAQSAVATAHEEDEFGDFPEQPVRRMSGSQDRTAAPLAVVTSRVASPSVVVASHEEDEFGDFPDQPTQSPLHRAVPTHDILARLFPGVVTTALRSASSSRCPIASFFDTPTVPAVQSDSSAMVETLVGQALRGPTVGRVIVPTSEYIAAIARTATANNGTRGSHGAAPLASQCLASFASASGSDDDSEDDQPRYLIENIAPVRVCSVDVIDAFFHDAYVLSLT